MASQLSFFVIIMTMSRSAGRCQSRSNLLIAKLRVATRETSQVSLSSSSPSSLPNQSVHHRKANSLHRHCPKRRAPRPYQHQTQHQQSSRPIWGRFIFQLYLRHRLWCLHYLERPMGQRSKKEGQMWRMSSGRRRSPLVPAPPGSQRHKIPSQQETDFKSIFWELSMKAENILPASWPHQIRQDIIAIIIIFSSSDDLQELTTARQSNDSAEGL